MEIVLRNRLGPSLNQDLEELKRPRRDADGAFRAHELAGLRVEDAVTESDAHLFPRKDHRSPMDPPRRRGRCGASVIIAQNVRVDGVRRTEPGMVPHSPRVRSRSVAGCAPGGGLHLPGAGESRVEPLDTDVASRRAQSHRPNGGEPGVPPPGRTRLPPAVFRVRRRWGSSLAGPPRRHRPDGAELPGVDLVRRRGI